MQLSEAIRLGSMWKPQGVHALIDGGRTCALGAAIDAIGMLRLSYQGVCRPYEWDALCVRWPVLFARVQDPVDVSRRELKLGDTMVLLNDIHGWTREAIADWVEGIERSQAAPSTAVVEPVAVLT